MFDKLEKQIKSIPKGASIIFSLVISASILTMMSLGNGKITIALILFCTLLCVILTKAGELILQAFRLTEIKAWLPMAFVVGFVAISLSMVALTLIVNLSPLMAFSISALLVLSLNYFGFRKATVSPSIDWTDTAVSLTLAIIIGFLTKIPISSATTLLDTGVLPIWNDYYIHGITIASFGSPFSLGSDMELIGVSRIFYHYAPYMIPAAFQAVSGLSGLALSTSLLLPFGLLIAAFGSYAFAVELGGRLSGLLALTVIICLPAFSVFIQSGWLNFYWLLLIAPSSGYAIGVSAVVCALTVTYLNKNDGRVLLFIMLLLFSLILIRAHMFLLIAPTILTVILLHRWRANSWLLLGGMVSTIIIGLLTLHFSTYLHTLWVEHSVPQSYLYSVTQAMFIYGQPVKLLEYPFSSTMSSQILMILVAVLGGYSVLYPLFLRLNVRYIGFHAKDAIPLLLIVSFIGLMLFAPIAKNGDFTEYKHRHFLLLYVITAIYTITYAYTLMNNYVSNKYKLQQWVYSLVMGMVIATILLSWDSNPARPNDETMPWARNFHDQPITLGLLEASQYIGEHARLGDVLAMGVSSVSGSSDILIETISLTGIPAFIARSDLKKLGSQCVQETVHQRLSALQELSSITNWTDAQKFLQTNGIRWFLVPSGESPKWDPDLKFAVFSINGLSVYDAGHVASEIFKKTQC